MSFLECAAFLPRRVDSQNCLYFAIDFGYLAVRVKKRHIRENSRCRNYIIKFWILSTMFNKKHSSWIFPILKVSNFVIRLNWNHGRKKYMKLWTVWFVFVNIQYISMVFETVVFIFITVYTRIYTRQNIETQFIFTPVSLHWPSKCRIVKLEFLT